MLKLAQSKLIANGITPRIWFHQLTSASQLKWQLNSQLSKDALRFNKSLTASKDATGTKEVETSLNMENASKDQLLPSSLKSKPALHLLIQNLAIQLNACGKATMTMLQSTQYQLVENASHYQSPPQLLIKRFAINPLIHLNAQQLCASG